MNPVTCWKCGVWCCDFAQGNKNLERNKTQNNKIAEVYPVLQVVVGSSFWHVGKIHHTQFQGSSSQIKNATAVSMQGLCQWLLGGRKFMLINSVVDSLNGPLLILVVARWWEAHYVSWWIMRRKPPTPALPLPPLCPSWHRRYKHNMTICLLYFGACNVGYIN